MILEACVQVRNEGVSRACEGNEIFHAASKWSHETTLYIYN